MAQTGLNLWVDITNFATIFSPQQPLTQQIDEMSDLKSCINQVGMTIPDSLHAMLILHALTSTYKVIQQTLLANIQDYKTLTSADMRSHLISEELHQGKSATINVIRPTKKAADSCNWCGGSGHWE